MEQHVYDYLKNLAWRVMPGRDASTRQAQRDHVISATRDLSLPTWQHRFVANVAWSRLGYGGGI